MNGFKLEFRDWINIALVVGGLAVINWRLGILESKVEKLDSIYVRRDVFEVQLDNLRLGYAVKELQDGTTVTPSR